ncbi:hypothetical protein D3C86_628090 [compost metagenome]
MSVCAHTQRFGDSLLRDQHQRAAVFEHVGDALGRVIRVQRHVGATRLEHGEQSQQQMLGTLHGHADPHFRADAEFDQFVCQTVGLLVEFAVSQLRVRERHGQCIRARSHLLADQLMNAQIFGEAFIGAVPVMHDALIFGLFQQRQITDALLRIADHALQQTYPVLRHARDGRGVEQVVGVGQRGVQFATLLISIEGQVELGGAPLPLDHAQCQAGRRGHRGNVRDLRLVVVHHLEQRRVAEAAFQLQGFDQALERQVLMGLGAQRGFLDAAQQIVDTGLAVQLRAQHLGVDEETDQAFDFGTITVGNRHADADVVLPGVTVQQHVERTEQQHEQGDVVFLCSGAQLLGQLPVDGEFVARAAIARHRRARMIEWQFQHRVFVTQLRLPVFKLARLLARLQPAALPQRVVAVLDRQRRELRLRAGIEGVVAADEFVDQHVHRPAVGHYVVQGQQQDMFLLGELEQGHPQQRTGRQIERQYRLLFGGFSHCTFALIGRQCAEIHLFDPQRRSGRHLLQAVIGLTGEHRAQGFMPRHQAGERLFQRRQVQVPGQPYRARQVIGAAVRVQLPEEPHALLGVRQRLAILGLDAGRNRETGEIHALLVQGRKEHLALFQGQPDKPASKFQGVFSIHFWVSGSVAGSTKARRPYKTNADRKN